MIEKKLSRPFLWNERDVVQPAAYAIEKIEKTPPLIFLCVSPEGEARFHDKISVMGYTMKNLGIRV
jgi:hypothetical protein